jgi:hypothetical protein
MLPSVIGGGRGAWVSFDDFVGALLEMQQRVPGNFANKRLYGVVTPILQEPPPTPVKPATL